MRKLFFLMLIVSFVGPAGAQASTAAAANSKLCGFSDIEDHHDHVIFEDVNQHIDQLYENSGWQWQDLTKINGVGPAASASAITCYEGPNTESGNEYYLDPNWHVIRFYWVNGYYYSADLTAITGGPTAAAASALTSYDNTSFGAANMQSTSEQIITFICSTVIIHWTRTAPAELIGPTRT